jgi:hypothetical protein
MYPHLHFPPPFASMHVVKHPDGFGSVRVVPFRFYNEMWSKFRITPESLDALKNVTEVDIDAFSCDHNLMTLERGAMSGDAAIDNHVQFPCILV